MPILGPVPNSFSPNTVIRSSLVNANFAAIVAGVNAGAAASGINSDITQLLALTNFVSTGGTITGTLMVGTLDVTNLATFGGNIVMTGTGAIQVPLGSTAQRPSPPVAGDIRYNTTTNSFEGYGGVSPSWSSFGSSTGFPMSVGLKIINNPIVPTKRIDITAVIAQLATSSGSGVVRTSVSVVIDATTVGANGLDTGSLAPSTWYNVYLIDNGSSTAGLLSLSATSPNLPVGYVYISRVGAFRTDGSSNFFMIQQTGADATFVVTASTNTTVYPTLTTISVSGTATAFSVAPSAPPTATKAKIVLPTTVSNFTNIQTNIDTSSFVLSGSSPQTAIDVILQSSSLYYFTSSTGGSVLGVGWTDSVVAF